MKQDRKRIPPSEIEAWARQWGVRLRPFEYALLSALDRVRCRPKAARGLRAMADINDPKAVTRVMDSLGKNVMTVDQDGNPIARSGTVKARNKNAKP